MCSLSPSLFTDSLLAINPHSRGGNYSGVASSCIWMWPFFLHACVCLYIIHIYSMSDPRPGKHSEDGAARQVVDAAPVSLPFLPFVLLTIRGQSAQIRRWGSAWCVSATLQVRQAAVAWLNLYFFLHSSILFTIFFLFVSEIDLSIWHLMSLQFSLSLFCCSCLLFSFIYVLISWCGEFIWYL